MKALAKAGAFLEVNMIKKIQRNKKVNNQDKQAPKTIQELMQRYDLNNNKIEEYLDYLVNYLNERGI